MAEDIIPGALTGEGPAPRGGYGGGADYRQLQRPAESIQAYHLHADTGQPWEALGRAFREFEGIGSNVYTKLRTKQGAEAGAAAGMQPGFQPKSAGLSAITAYGSAYDAAAHVSYVNNTHAQIESALSAAEQDNAGDPNAFAAHAKAVGDAIVKEAPAIYQPELANAIALRTAAGVARTREQAIQTARSDAFESYTSTTDSRIDSTLQTAATLPHDQQAAVVQKTLADNRTQLDALVKARAITPEHSAVLQEKFQKDMAGAVQKQYTTNTVNHMMDIARSGDVDSADRALKQYISDPKNTDADKEEVTKDYLAQADKFHQVQSRVYANDIAKLGQSLVGDEKHPGAFGKGVESKIHGLYKIGALSPEQLHSLMDQSMRNQVQSIKDDSSNLLVDNAVHGTGPKLDPANKADQKAADTYFNTHVATSNVPPLSDQWTASATTFARLTNIIPATVQSQLRIGLISGDPATAARAAAAGERIRAANPSIDPYAADPRSAVLANEINANLHAGMPPQTAYQTAMMTVDRPKDQKEAIGKAYTAEVKKDPNGNNLALRDAMDSLVPGRFFGTGTAPPAPMALQGEYNRLVSTYYGMNQDIGKARALAAQQVQTSWGVSQMNGQPELVKYPPERLGVPADVIRADAEAHAKAAGFTGDPALVRLVPNEYTDSSHGRYWTLAHMNTAIGAPDVLLGQNNQRLGYGVPQGQDFAKAHQALVEQKLAAARVERAKDRASSAEQIQGEQQLSDFYLGSSAGRAAMAH